MTYAELVVKNKDKLVIECFKIINNETMMQTYVIYTNLHSDFGISTTLLRSLHTHKKSEFRKRLAELKKLTGFKLKLVSINNDKSYTRLIYRMQAANNKVLN